MRHREVHSGTLMTVIGILTSLTGLTQSQRDDLALQMTRSGTIRMWPFVPVPVRAGNYEGTIFVASDYFALGEEEDVIRVPLSGNGAQRVADAMGCFLPTSKIVDDIFIASTVRLIPEQHELGSPWDGSMNTMRRIGPIEANISSRLVGAREHDIRVGHKKDIVVCQNVNRFHVAIYGWHRPDGTRVQDLNWTAHDAMYSDYSHGTRLVKREMLIDGATHAIDEVMQDPILHELISYEPEGTYARRPGV